MKWIENIVNNQVVFYGFLALLCIGSIVLFTMIYMDRKNLRLFQKEEKELLEEPIEEEIKVTPIVETIEEKPKANLEELLEQMQADLDKKEDVVAIFEQEQEEKAIISYQELLQSKNKNTTGTNQELLSAIEQIGSPKEEVPKVEEIFPKEEPKKFKTTDFISPIYGKVDNHIEYPKIPNFNEVGKSSIELSKTTDFLEDSSNHNDAFLNALKEFRSHLE